MNFPVNIAVVGCGAWGRNYGRILQALPEAELLWLCDQNPVSLSRASEIAPGVRTTSDLARVFADARVQAVVIATNTEQHYSHVMRALAAAKHVLVEKPMATSVGSAQAMLGAAQDADRVLMVGHLMVYHPATQALRALVRSGALGSLQHVYALRVNLPGQREGVGPLWSLAPHDLSLIMELLGQPVRLVAAQPDTQGQVGLINLHFSDKLLAQIRLTLPSPRKERCLVVTGSRRVAIFDDTRSTGKLMVFDRQCQPPWPWNGASGLGGVHDQNLEQDPWRDIRFRLLESTGVEQQIGTKEPLALQCQHFLTCVAQGQQPRSSGHEGLDVVRLLAAAERSLHGGGIAIQPERLDGKLITIQPEQLDGKLNTIQPEQLDGKLNTIQAGSSRVQEEIR